MTAQSYEHLEKAWTANPFSSASARRHSSYCAFSGSELIRLLETSPASAFANVAHEQFRSFVLSDDFSCLAGKSAIRRGTYRVGAYDRFDDADATEGLARDLFAFTCERRGFESDFTTFVALFRNDGSSDEAGFERRLWSQLQRLHDLDAPFHAWDARVDADPASARFSFSFAQHAYFVVGLHPHASRTSRHFPWSALVFNSHEQFEHLKRDGLFAGLQRQIRSREVTLDGSLNPNLAGYGDVTEARQYSGRAAPPDWRCPLRVEA